MSDVWVPLAVVLLAIGVVLLAVLVGAALPVLLQLRQTLASARRNLDRLGPEADRTLADVRKAVTRLERIGGQLEEGGQGVVRVVRELGEVGSALGKLRQSMRTAAAVGGAVAPAIVAAVSALTSNGRARPGGEAPQPPPEAGDDAPQPADPENERRGADS
jgi:uncharacterized protein YoxC